MFSAMSPSFALFRTSKPKDHEESQDNMVQQALPAVWYRSPAMYELERRAIFSKRWLLATHKLRFVNPGDYVRIVEAGIDFFLIKNRKGNISGFHNVCRHRAYPIVENPKGTVNILACKYHGWSYGLTGKLAKAPRYQDVEGFDKENISLFPIHTHIDHLGFVWVNMEASEKPSIAWEDDFESVDRQPRLQNFDFTHYRFDHQWEMVGDYNWKTLADNYNECYHCPTGHPAIATVSDLSKYWVETKAGHIIHYNTDKPDVPGLGVYSTFLYPNACFTITPHFFYMMRCIPISASQTRMEYEVYRHCDATDEEFNKIDQTFKQVLLEDKDLCNNAQKNLNAGVFLSGPLHPKCEQGPLYFQKLVREMVMTHRGREQSEGKEIWPASPTHKGSEKQQEEIMFCEQLDCAGKKDEFGQLAW